MAVICVLLAGLVFAIFGKTVRYGFVYDDALYVLNNPIVQRGLTLRGILWSFTYGKVGHWHPLTWMSHMLDCDFYHLWAGGAHLTNVILQAATVVLLFLVFYKMTGAFWRCAFVAAAWTIHPLRAESVAWIAERKDVLSGLFFMLALGAYVRCVRGPSTARRVAVAVLFALGLMSKNMLVTFPCVLLLLDYWPLGRLSQRSQFVPLLKEKIPLFALSAFSCVKTFQVSEKVTAANHIPLWLRMENALVSCGIYLRQSVWPAGLSANYPNPTHAFPVWEVAGSLGLICLISAAACWLRKSRPWLFVGWFWFLGMLTPVIGLVQISRYAHADRYTYLPQIGLWIAGTWLAAELAGDSRNRRIALGGVAGAILCALSAAAWVQVSYWRNSFSLWSHALECNNSDPVAHGNLGMDLLDLGWTDDAITHLREAVRIDPDRAEQHRNLGVALEARGHKGDLDEAIAEYREAVRLDPDYVLARNNLGRALEAKGDLDGAAAQYREALRAHPDSAGVRFNLANLQLEEGRTQEAIDNFREALRSDPDSAEGHNNLGNALVGQGDLGGAIAEYREALRLRPDHANAHYNLGNILFRQGEAGGAIQELQKALELRPGNVDYESGLAWVLSTASEISLRNGARALELATAANQSTGGNNPLILHTLAAAYAETGDFPKAVATARKALQLLESQPGNPLAGDLSREIKLYEEGRRF